MSNKKPFSETKVGQFLKEKLPDVVDKIGKSFPAANLLKLIVGKKLSPEDQIKFDELILEQEKIELEEKKLEVQDRDSARNREIELAKNDKPNYTQNALAYVGVFGFFSIVGFILSKGIGNVNAETAFIIGNLTGLSGAIAKDIYGYYFGSSKGSADKTKLLK